MRRTTTARPPTRHGGRLRAGSVATIAVLAAAAAGCSQDTGPESGPGAFSESTNPSADPGVTEPSPTEASGESTTVESSPSDEPTAEPLVTEGPETGDLLVHGVVTNGTEPQPGVDLVVSLLPIDPSSVKIGDVDSTYTTEPVTTDADGAYAIMLDPGDVGAEFYPTADGVLTFELDLTAEDRFALFSGNDVTRVGDPAVWRTDGADGAASELGSVLDLSVDLSSSTITVTDSTGKSIDRNLPSTS